MAKTLLAAATLALVWPALSPADAASASRRPTLQVLASLGPSPGAVFPAGSLAVGKRGVIYGASSQGGTYGGGTIFSLTPPVAPSKAWTQAIIYSLSGLQGADPYGGLVVDGNGTLYGIAYHGGANGYGSVFTLTDSGGEWVESTLFSFDGRASGGTPHGGLLVAANGSLYGTTTSGGSFGTGVVFQLTLPAAHGSAWTETVLANFPAGGTQAGTYPYAGLVRDKSGALYGTTLEGGASGCGTIFQLAPPQAGGPWTLSKLHDFNCNSDGAYPLQRMLLDKAGALTGIASQTGSSPMGTVFRLTPPASGGTAWAFSTLLSFPGGAGGSAPEGDLSVDTKGALYGAAYGGGSASDGLIFKLVPPSKPKKPWTEIVLHNFTGTDGAMPLTVDSDGAHAIMGTTCCGGAAGDGTIFRMAR